MQQGSIIQTDRKQGPNVWVFRWSEKNRNGRRVYRKRVIGTVEQYPDGEAARVASAAPLTEINGDSSRNRVCKTTIEQICEHFELKGIAIRGLLPKFRQRENLSRLYPQVGAAILCDSIR